MRSLSTFSESTQLEIYPVGEMANKEVKRHDIGPRYFLFRWGEFRRPVSILTKP